MGLKTAVGVGGFLVVWGTGLFGRKLLGWDKSNTSPPSGFPVLSLGPWTSLAGSIQVLGLCEE